MKKWVLIGWLIGILGTVRAQQVPALDPSRAVDTSFSSVFDELEIIPLETNNKSVFGVVKQLLVTSNCFIILDPDTDAILFFDKKGRFIAKYKNKLQRYRINSIQLDPVRNALLVFSQNKNYNITAKKIQEYLSVAPTRELPHLVRATRLNLDDLGKLRFEELPSPSYLLANPGLLGKDQFVFGFVRSNTANNDTLDYQLKIVDKNGLIKNFFPYNKKTDALFKQNNAFQCSINTTLSDSVLLVTRPFDSVIYTLSPSSIAERYKVIVPKQETSGGAFGRESVSFFDGGTMIVSSPYFGSGRNGGPIIFNSNSIGPVFDLGQLLFFSLKQAFTYNYLIYDKSSGQIYSYKELRPDSSSYMFPLEGSILASDGKNIYQSVTARDLFKKRKDASKSKLKYQESLARFYNTGKETDNPVLIRIKPKEKQGVK